MVARIIRRRVIMPVIWPGVITMELYSFPITVSVFLLVMALPAPVCQRATAGAIKG